MPAAPISYAVLCAGIVSAALPAGLHTCSAQTPSRVAAELRVSDDGRRIVTRDGAPFFWLGDTAWELFHRLDRDEADLYLEDRARKGFNVIQAVVLAELDGLHTPNAYGDFPLIDDDPARTNEAYFKHVDYVVGKANDLGMYVGLLPTWGDKFNKRWGVGPEVFTPENARAFGRFLSDRYREAGIVWILGGDRAPETSEHLAIIHAMADGIESGAGGGHLTTYHPMGGRRSWEWFHESGWLDLHLFQSGHSAPDAPNYEMTAEGYALRPARPVIDGEPRYEDHPVDWNPENGWFEAFDVRQAMYWSVLQGAAGHTYGNHNIWQMWRPGREAISSARTPWREALAHPGATQVGFAKRLFLSRPFERLVPDTSLVVAGPREGGARVAAASDAAGRYAIIYAPYGSPIDIDVSALSGHRFRAWWFDPRTGVATAVGPIAPDGVQRFDPPGPETRGNDWVLVLDEESAGFRAPGVFSASP